MAGLRNLVAAVALMGVVGAMGVPTLAQAATPIAQATEQKVAVIKIVVQERDGTVVRAPVKAVRWGDTATFRLSSADHDHIVHLRPASSGGKLNVDVTYGRDGSPLSAEHSVQVGARRGSVVHKDNGARVTVTVIPTKVTVDAHPVD